MWNAKKKIDDLNKNNTKKHNEYVAENNRLIKEYSDNKDLYNNQINIINSEKIAMREELRNLYDFLKFIGGSLERKISMNDFLEESPAPNIDSDEENALDRVEPDSYDWGILHFSNVKHAKDFEKQLYWQSLKYKQNLSKKRVLAKRMTDGVEIAILYRNILATSRDMIREKIIPEFEYIKAFLLADAIREKVIANQDVTEAEPAPIIEYKGTKYDRHYKFVKNTFDFWDLCQAFFSKSILTNLMKQEEITEEQRKEFEESIFTIQNKLVELEGSMEVSRSE